LFQNWQKGSKKKKKKKTQTKHIIKHSQITPPTNTRGIYCICCEAFGVQLHVILTRKGKSCPMYKICLANKRGDSYYLVDKNTACAKKKKKKRTGWRLLVKG